jgi:serine/threonine protein kinase
VKRTNLVKQKDNLGSLQLSKKLLVENKCPFLISGLFFYSSEKYLFSGMRIAEGGDLASFLERWRGKGDAFRRLGEEGIMMVLAGIILGLEYLHGKRLIYCDLKIDNVLIDRKGYPLLADFELISDKEEIPIEEFQGTVTSMGPELHSEKTIDKGIDLWTLGILLYTVTFNELPYQ